MTTAAIHSSSNGPATMAEFERRLQRLERAVEELSQSLREPRGPSKDPKWYINGAGRFANDPDFDEIVRLGREYRESLRPRSGKLKPGKAAPAVTRRKGSRARS